MENREFNNNTEFYPIVLIPKKISDNLNFGIDETSVRCELGIKKPVKPYNSHPTKPNKIKTVDYETLSYLDLGCIVYALAICIIVGIILILFNVMNNEEAVFTCFIFGLWLTIMGKINNMHLFPITQTEQKKEEITEDKFREEMNLYEEEYIDYKNKKLIADNRYEEKITEYNLALDINRNAIIRKIHQKSLNPSQNAKRIFSTSKRGSSEIIFLEVLNEHLREFTNIDMAISNNSYCPDITLISPDNNLHIDLEIDEPYTLKDKIPIHYVDSDDVKRNEYFLNHNWCIIRFSEKQIVNEPFQCVQTIASIIDSIQNLEKEYMSMVKRSKTWSYEDAIILARNNFRKEYL